MTTTLFRGALTCALLSTTALTALNAPAMAQTNQSIEPAFRGVDDNGVDLISGTYPFTIVEGTIGSGDTGLSVVRTGTNAYGTATWQNIYVSQSVSGSVRTADVVLGDRSESFTSTSGGAFVAAQGNGATLAGGLNADFTYTDAGGTAYTFGAATDDMHGASNLCSHAQADSNGCIALATSIIRPDGAQVSLDWDVRALCATAFNQDGGLDCAYGWRLIGVDNSFGYALDFSYASDTAPLHQLPSGDWFKRSGATLSNGAATSTISYDYISSTVTEITDTGGRVWRLTSGANSLGIRRPGSSSDDISVTFSGGTVTQVVRDGIATTYARSVSGSNATTTITDAASNVTTVVADLSLGRIISVTDPLSRTTSYAYDGESRLTRVTMPEGNSIGYSYDGRGNVTETRLREKDDTSDTGDDIVASASYDSSCANVVTCNQPNSVTDANGQVTDFTYDSTHGGLLSVTAPAPSGSGTRPHTRYSYTQTDGEYRLTGVSACATGSTGSPTCVGTSDETRTVIGYDSSGNATSVEQRSGNGSGAGALSATSAMTYDGYGNLLTLDGPISGTADTVRYRYNAARQIVGVTGPDPDGGGNPLHHPAVRTTYGSDGQATTVETGIVDSQSDSDWAGFTALEEVQADYDSHHRPVVQRLASGSTTYALTQTSYDALGRVQCTAQRMNASEFASLPSDACTLDTQGSYGPDRIARTSYDNAGRVNLIQTGYAVSGVQADEATTTYTGNGRVETVTDAEGNRTTYEYDGFDRLVKTRYPSTAQGAGTSSTSDYEQLTLDAAGNVTSRRLRDGDSIAFTYDALNRVIAKDPPGSEPTVSYAYDLLGRLTGASVSGHSLSFTFDALGRNLTQAGPQGTASYQYDAAGRRTRLTYPGSGLYVDYDYDAAGDVIAIRENGVTSGAGVLATFAYDDRRRRTSLTRGNGTVTSYAYDNADRLTQLVQNLNGTASDLTLDFSHNPASQIASATRSNDAYAFTGLVNVNVGGTYNGLNQISTLGTAGLTWDARGNLASIGATGFSYTSENMLTGVIGITLAYDPLLRLYENVAGGATYRFAYDGGNLIAEYDGSDALQRRYVHGPGADEPLVWYEGTGTSDRRWLHADERGSIVATSDGSGNATNISSYDEYGLAGTANAGRFQYTGQVRLSGIPLLNYRARIYWPGLGRFLQTDPIGYGGGMNLYAYVGNDPANSADPSGLADPDKPKPACKSECGILTGTRIPGHAPPGLFGYLGGNRFFGSIDSYKVGLVDNATKSPVGSPWIEIRGTGAYAGLFLTTQTGGVSRCRWHPLVCTLWADPDVRDRMRNSWTEANRGPEAQENEHGFWISHIGNDYIAHDELIGSGPIMYGVIARRPSAADIYFHTHNFYFLEPGLSGLDSGLLQRNAFTMVIFGREGWQVWESPLSRRRR